MKSSRAVTSPATPGVKRLSSRRRHSPVDDSVLHAADTSRRRLTLAV